MWPARAINAGWRAGYSPGPSGSLVLEAKRRRVTDLSLQAALRAGADGLYALEAGTETDQNRGRSAVRAAW